MIIGVGIDIVDAKLNAQSLSGPAGQRFLQRILSESELAVYLTDRAERFVAGRFAAKEAVLKCLGTGMQDGISLKDISIERSGNGQPIIKLTGLVEQIAENLGIIKWHLSISHSPSYSIAYVVAEGGDCKNILTDG